MKQITVQVGPIALTLPCGDNQTLQYAQAQDMMEMVMKQFNEEFEDIEIEAVAAVPLLRD
jgi:hypothetical protein